MGRQLGVDVGRRRVGLAISDPSGTLARPLRTLTVDSPRHVLDAIVAVVAALAAEDDGLGGIVVGLPRRLDGSPTDETGLAQQVADGLQARTGLPVATEDERLSSHEANARLAVRERDWRRRKAALDAAAAAVILQDYLDRTS